MPNGNVLQIDLQSFLLSFPELRVFLVSSRLGDTGNTDFPCLKIVCCNAAYLLLLERTHAPGILLFCSINFLIYLFE